MRKGINMKVTILLLLSLFLRPEEKSPEQIAFDYFVENNLDATYSNSGKLFFSGNTKSLASISGNFAKCFSDDSGFREFFYNHKKTTMSELVIDFDETKDLRLSKRIRKKGLNLEIYRSIEEDGIAYVCLKVYRINRFVDHFLYKISLTNNEVMDFCKSGEII